jgi:hypothetical protein
MLRITAEDEVEGVRTLRVEGTVAGPWVDELRTVVHGWLARGSDLRLDVSGVGYVDRDGALLLRELSRRPVQIDGYSSFINELLRGGDQ